MGEAKRRAEHAWHQHQIAKGQSPTDAPPEVLRKWRANHQKGRGSSNYTRTARVSVREIVQMVTTRSMPRRVREALGVTPVPSPRPVIVTDGNRGGGKRALLQAALDAQTRVDQPVYQRGARFNREDV